MLHRLVPLLLLAGCGPMTLWSSCFPFRYDVATRLSFAEGDHVVTQEKVSDCAIVDQTDSIANNIETRSRTERHSFATADGGILVYPDLHPCRWTKEETLPAGALPVVSGSAWPRPKPALAVHDAEAWWFDRRDDPTRVETLHSDALLAGTLPVRVGGDARIVEGEVTRTLLVDFPWLVVAATHGVREALEATGRPRHGWIPRPYPLRFEGVVAEAWRLENGARCDAAGPGPIGRHDDCVYVSECGPLTKGPCRRLLGGLAGEVDEGATRVSFDATTPRPGWIGRRTRHDHLPAGAPMEAEMWSPTACVGQVCVTREEVGTGPPRDYPPVLLPGAEVVVLLEWQPVEVQVWDLVRGRAEGG